MEDIYNNLSEKAKKALTFIVQYQKSNGFSPTYEEIKRAIGTKSTRGVVLQLKKLENLGCIRREPNSRRAIKILIQPADIQEEKIKVPIVGEVKAGYGGITVEDTEGYRKIPISLTGGRRDVLLLRVRGESMTKAGFNPGDLAIVVPQSVVYDGDIVVVFDPENGDQTIKRFKKLRNYAILLPESDDSSYEPKIGINFIIQGKVIGKFSETD